MSPFTQSINAGDLAGLGQALATRATLVVYEGASKLSRWTKLHACNILIMTESHTLLPERIALMSTVTTVVPADHSLASKEPINNQLWRRLVDRIVMDLKFQELIGHEDSDAQHRWAERILDQALGFLRLCAAEPEGRYQPSVLVDIGWHTFILHTREYATFCQELTGGFIHHAPSDEDDVNFDSRDLIRTVTAMQVRNITVDEVLWTSPSECQGSKCYSCSNGGCRS